MKYRITTTRSTESYGIVARLAAGEEIHTVLKAIARERAIPSAALTGLGAVNDVTLAFFDPAQRVYREMRLIEDLEVATMTGNIAWVGDEPIIHLHGVVSRTDCTTAAGHIMRGVVSVTLEVMIRVDSVKLARRHDADFGLNLLDLD
jgi:predicted DNA-binding protein with PD1-like motif